MARAFLAVTLLLWPLVALGQEKNLAVFNFQLKAGGEEWVWLEKFLSDQITTDFSRAEGMNVVARDEMQLLAAKMNWVPEMTADPAKMGMVRQQLKIEHLITGVCSVAGERIELIAQIIQVDNRQELHRVSVTGKPADVLALQKKLSAELLSRLTQRPAEKILPELPVWTRSIPAAKALYQGMDLYDQGRYAEAWGKFRQAGREDTGYIEAVYWVGKMYYFMDRYEHARRELERFVYLDLTHPRLRDAMVEYIRACQSELSLEELIGLYEHVGPKFAWHRIHDGSDAGVRERDKLSFADWSLAKRSLLRSQLGRPDEAALDIERSGFEEHKWGIFREQLQALIRDHYKRTGKVLPASVLRLARELEPSTHLLKVGTNAFEEMLDPPRTVRAPAASGGDKWDLLDRQQEELKADMLCCDGGAIRRIKLLPLVEGGGGQCELWLAGKRIFPLEQAAKGLVVEGIPPLPRQSLTVTIKPPPQGQLRVRGLRVEVEVERLGPVGALRVNCQDAPVFQLKVDGILYDAPGLVGPLSAGKHTVRFEPLPEDKFGQAWQTEVVVEAGKVTDLLGRLPLNLQGAWQGWTSQLLASPASYPAGERLMEEGIGQPGLLLADEAIYVVWSWNGDLWISVSADGRGYSPPRRLELPVSSAWLELNPRLIRDESGRFVLGFESNRNARHYLLPYLCWSRDLYHWSNPLLMSERGSAVYDLRTVVSHAGRLFCVKFPYRSRKLEILTSRDGATWETCFTVDARQGYEWYSGVLRNCPDGQLELRATQGVPREPNNPNQPVDEQTLVMASGDGRQWSESRRVAPSPYVRSRGIGWSTPDGHQVRLLLRPWEQTEVWTSSGWIYDCNAFVRVEKELPSGQWQVGPEIQSPLLMYPWASDYHPKWGCVIVHEDRVRRNQREGGGLYVLRGPALDSAGPLVASASQASQPVGNQPPKPARPEPIISRVREPDGQVSKVRIEERPDPVLTYKCPPITKPEGQLEYVAGFGGAAGASFTHEQLKPAPAGCGTTSPDALVASGTLGKWTFCFALDKQSPDAQGYDLLRIDPTGKFDFSKELVVARHLLILTTQDRRSASYYVKLPLALELDGRGMAVLCNAAYIETEDQAGKPRRQLEVSLSTCAQAKCRFGDLVAEVTLGDGDGNLEVTDRTLPPWGEKARDGGLYMQGAGRLDKVVAAWDSPKGKRDQYTYFGQPLLVDGRWYEVVCDGKTVSARPAKLPLGVVRGQHKWEVSLVGPHLLQGLCSDDAGQVTVPVGKYQVVQYDIYRGGVIDVSDPLDAAGKPLTIEVRADRQCELEIGLPLKATLTAQPIAGGCRFAVEYRDRYGNKINYFNRPNKNSWFDFIDITDSAGKLVSRVTMPESVLQVDWRYPPGLSDTFTAAVPPKLGEMEVQGGKVTVHIRQEK